MKKYEIKKDCTMLFCDISEKEWNKFIKIIDKDDIYTTEEKDYGIEDEPHITLLYGIHSEEVDREQAEKLLKSISVMELESDKISIFENEEFDVVKIDIIPSDTLLQIRKFLIYILPNTQTFPDYNPHMTIAYVKKGKGKKYIEKFKENKSFIFNTGVYSDFDYKKKKFKLKEMNESLKYIKMFDTIDYYINEHITTAEDMEASLNNYNKNVQKYDKEEKDLKKYIEKSFKNMKK